MRRVSQSATASCASRRMAEGTSLPTALVPLQSGLAGLRGGTPSRREFIRRPASIRRLPLTPLIPMFVYGKLVLSTRRALEQFSLGLSRQGVASMGEPGDGISGRDRLDCHLHGLPEGLLGASTQSAQDGLELGEGLFNRCE